MTPSAIKNAQDLRWSAMTLCDLDAIARSAELPSNESTTEDVVGMLISGVNDEQTQTTTLMQLVTGMGCSILFVAKFLQFLSKIHHHQAQQ